MRRNFTSLVKFLCLCLITILLTLFLYKTIFRNERDFDGTSREAHPHGGAFFSGAAKNVHLKKIDWHDYKYIENEEKRVGVGEHGVAGHTKADEEGDRRRLFDTNGFNALLSM